MKGSSIIVALLAVCATNVASFPTGNSNGVAGTVRSVEAPHELWARKKKNSNSTSTATTKGNKSNTTSTATTKGNKKNKTSSANAQATKAAANTNGATDIVNQLEAALGSSNGDLLTSLESLLGARDLFTRHHQGKKTTKSKNATAKAAKANKSARAESVDLFLDDENKARSIEDLETRAELFERHHQGKKTTKAKNATAKAAKADKANSARDESLVDEEEVVARAAEDLEKRADLFARHHQGKKTTKAKNASAKAAKADKANTARDEVSVDEEEVVARSAEELKERAALFARHHQGKKTTKSKNATAKAAKSNNARDMLAEEVAEEEIEARAKENVAEIFSRHHQGKKTTAAKNSTKAAGKKAAKADARGVDVADLLNADHVEVA